LPLKAMEQYSKILSSKSQMVLRHPSSNIDFLYFRTNPSLIFLNFFWVIFTIKWRFTIPLETSKETPKKAF
jgi:hypothetical protein